MRACVRACVHGCVRTHTVRAQRRRNQSSLAVSAGLFTPPICRHVHRRVCTHVHAGARAALAVTLDCIAPAWIPLHPHTRMHSTQHTAREFSTAVFRVFVRCVYVCRANTRACKVGLSTAGEVRLEPQRLRDDRHHRILPHQDTTIHPHNQQLPLCVRALRCVPGLRLCRTCARVVEATPASLAPRPSHRRP